jgi:class 3 adenylate cyclase/type II secretory pathway predicted ATPase ExeA
MRCTSCGFENPLEFKFCGQCGKELAVAAMAAERRQLTVMFCDLAGSTELAQRLDPEDWREVLRSYQTACEKVVHQFDGHIAQYLGDGILVYFGYPRAHEGDACRATHAGLEIVQEIKRLSAHWQRHGNIQLAVRVGIHTGLVVVGEVGGVEKHEHLALGHTPNIAARLQSLAAPDTVVISAITHQLVQGYFVCENLGAPTLKGVDQPLEIYRVQQETGALSRLEVARKLTPLVGRRQELAELLARWQQTINGAGQIVLLSGEAGIGKSRLRREFEECLTAGTYEYLRGRCSPYHQQSGVFYPVINMLAQRLKFTRTDAAEKKLNQIEQLLASYGLALRETVPLFAGLLAVPFTTRYAPRHLNLELQKQKTREAVLSLVLAMAVKKPVYLVMDDLHWIDDSTLEMLSHLVSQVAATRLFCLFSFRPTFQPPWNSLPHLQEMRLAPLSRDETAMMIQNMMSGKTLPTDVLAQLVSKTDGMPLFVEELTKAVLESGQLNEQSCGDAPPSIPTTLYDSLMARLDRLATAREVAQLAATIGREFDYALLHAVSPLDEATLQSELRRLLDAGLLYRDGEKYLFKHALIRDAAYHSLLKSKRLEYHHQIAQALATQFRELAESDPGLVAYHQTAI